jgi:hypothetical protein
MAKDDAFRKGISGVELVVRANDGERILKYIGTLKDFQNGLGDDIEEITGVPIKEYLGGYEHNSFLNILMKSQADEKGTLNFKEKGIDKKLYNFKVKATVFFGKNVRMTYKHFDSVGRPNFVPESF